MHICDSQVFHMHFGWVHVLFRCSGDNISFCYQQTQHFRRWGENPLGWAGMGFVCMLPFCFYIVSVHAQLWLNMILKRVTMILVLPRLTHPPQPTHTHTHTHTRKDVCTHVKHTRMHACRHYEHCFCGQQSWDDAHCFPPVWASVYCLVYGCTTVVVSLAPVSTFDRNL